MSENKGVQIPSPIVPVSQEDTYPTHLAEYGKGGYRTVQSRNDISQDRKEAGMLVYEAGSGDTLRLKQDGTWESAYLNRSRCRIFTSLSDLPSDLLEGEIFGIQEPTPSAYLYIGGGYIKLG